MKKFFTAILFMSLSSNAVYAFEGNPMLWVDQCGDPSNSKYKTCTFECCVENIKCVDDCSDDKTCEDQKCLPKNNGCKLKCEEMKTMGNIDDVSR